MISIDSQKNTGLALVRAVAILLVLWEHGVFLLEFLAPEIHWRIPIDGVDVFFTLSGFLIGKILMRTEYTWSGLFTFWMRRWLRTIPLYYIFLFLYILLTYSHINGGILSNYTILYAFFLQNLLVPLDLFFWESWSLAVEEWFYLILPVLVFVVLNLKIANRINALILSGLLISTASVLWICSYSEYPENLYIKNMVVPRLFSILTGCIAADFHHRTKQKKSAQVLFLVGSVFMALSIIYKENLYVRYILTPASIATLLPLVSYLKNLPMLLNIGIHFLADRSYALYLLHMGCVSQIIERHFYPQNKLQAVLLFFVYVALSIGLAHLVYTFIERPILKTRNFYFPDKGIRARGV